MFPLTAFLACLKFELSGFIESDSDMVWVTVGDFLNCKQAEDAELFIITCEKQSLSYFYMNNHLLLVQCAGGVVVVSFMLS